MSGDFYEDGDFYSFTCLGARCTNDEFSEEVYNPEDFFTANENAIDFFQEEAQFIGMRHGISLFDDGLGEGMDLGDLGSWMDHSAFGVGQRVWEDDNSDDEVPYVYSYAMGNQSPTFWGKNQEWSQDLTLAYRGLMVGSPNRGPDFGDRLIGDATLTYVSNDGDDTVSATFSNINNIDKLKPHTVRTVSFSRVDAGGAGLWGFNNGNTEDNWIYGSFYGPNREEAAGVFEKSGIVGAFGAKRQ